MIHGYAQAFKHTSSLLGLFLDVHCLGDLRAEIWGCPQKKESCISLNGHWIWVNYNDLTATSLESWLIRGIIPKWPYFRCVNYYNLPRLNDVEYDDVDFRPWRLNGVLFFFQTNLCFFSSLLGKYVKLELWLKNPNISRPSHFWAPEFSIIFTHPMPDWLSLLTILPVHVHGIRWDSIKGTTWKLPINLPNPKFRHS